jgi:mono/diheme cytochrome c family protein
MFPPPLAAPSISLMQHRQQIACHQASPDGIIAKKDREETTMASSTSKIVTRIAMAAAVAAPFALPLQVDPAGAQDVSFGDRLYHDKADCQFCHGVNGDGHGDPRSPGKAPNLHETKLNRDQLIEVIGCGRPATEMPHFDKYAYEDKACYGQSAAELGKNIPPDPHSTPLTKREIEAVTDYVLAKFVGK